ncbi:MAG: HD-GYP domain-containing protein (c-di-GMP phosphodiesterase class II) [Moritella sp.]
MLKTVNRMDYLFMLIEQDISLIVVGTYIEKITQQTGDYRLTCPEWVSDETVIIKLKEMGIQRVLVNTSKLRLPTAAKAPMSSGEKTRFNAQITQAKALFSAAKVIQKKLFNNVKEGRDIDLRPIKRLTQESMDTLFKNADALVCAINLRNKDEYLFEHSYAVSILMTLFARYLGIEKSIIQELAIGAFLHDVGKTRTPNAILHKPGKLTAAEFEIMKLHVDHSIEIIKSIPGISHLSLEVAALHHEKLNGEGYPYGVSGDRISTYGRMLSICDIYDALTTNRCYKNSYTQVKAFNIMRNLAEEGQLDLSLVNSFIKCMGVYPVGSLVKLGSNRLAIVEQINQQDPIRPKVNTFYCLTKKGFETASKIDLAKQGDDKIVQSIRADDFDLDMEEIMRFLVSEA